MWTSWIPNLHQPKPNFLKNKLKFNFGNFEAMNGLYLPDICPKISARQISPKFRKHLVCLSHQCNVSSHWGFETVAGIVETVTLGNQALRFQCKTKFSPKKRKETTCLPLCSVPLKQPSFLVSADSSEWEHCHQVWFHQPTNQTSKQGSKESSKEATKHTF